MCVCVCWQVMVSRVNHKRERRLFPLKRRQTVVVRDSHATQGGAEGSLNHHCTLGLPGCCLPAFVCYVIINQRAVSLLSTLHSSNSTCTISSAFLEHIACGCNKIRTTRGDDEKHILCTLHDESSVRTYLLIYRVSLIPE